MDQGSTRLSPGMKAAALSFCVSEGTRARAVSASMAVTLSTPLAWALDTMASICDACASSHARNHGSGFYQGQVEAFVNIPVLLVSSRDTGLFNGSRGCVKSGMQNRAVCLAGSSEDVSFLVRQDDPCTFQGQFAGYSAPHNSGTNYQYIATLVG